MSLRNRLGAIQGSVAAWVFDHVPLPRWATPYIFGLIIGRMPHKIDEGPK